MYLTTRNRTLVTLFAIKRIDAIATGQVATCLRCLAPSQLRGERSQPARGEAARRRLTHTHTHKKKKNIQADKVKYGVDTALLLHCDSHPPGLQLKGVVSVTGYYFCIWHIITHNNTKHKTHCIIGCRHGKMYASLKKNTVVCVQASVCF